MDLKNVVNELMPLMLYNVESIVAFDKKCLSPDVSRPMNLVLLLAEC